jgi:ribonuclease HII
MVIAGVRTTEDAVKEFTELGVKDSKRLTPGRRKELAEAIGGRAKVFKEILSADRIDSERKKETLNIIEARNYAKVLAHLLLDLEPEEVKGTTAYVDSVDVDEKRFRDTIKAFLPDTLKGVKIVSKHKADDIYPVVGAASIIAKTTRDGEVERIAGELGKELGSGYPSDPATVQFLKDWYLEKGELPPYVRRSWKTVKDLIKEHDTKLMTLDDY